MNLINKVIIRITQSLKQYQDVLSSTTWYNPTNFDVQLPYAFSGQFGRKRIENRLKTKSNTTKGWNTLLFVIFGVELRCL